MKKWIEIFGFFEIHFSFYVFEVICTTSSPFVVLYLTSVKIQINDKDKCHSLQLGLFTLNYRRDTRVDFQNIHKWLLIRIPKSYFLTYLLWAYVLCPLYFEFFTTPNAFLCKMLYLCDPSKHPIILDHFKCFATIVNLI